MSHPSRYPRDIKRPKEGRGSVALSLSLSLSLSPISSPSLQLFPHSHRYSASLLLLLPFQSGWKSRHFDGSNDRSSRLWCGFSSSFVMFDFALDNFPSLSNRKTDILVGSGTTARSCEDHFHPIPRFIGSSVRFSFAPPTFPSSRVGSYNILTEATLGAHCCEVTFSLPPRLRLFVTVRL
ncbi:hypothetical protein MA16_Dca009078 [Dendrobium catenatum]|uniref:Uncharacterized protein n=1 Tax=Dendrobium catenatum TaxID=906689 RepID=A0A2I0VRH9_9ASPA|nr:hypothetical protein MA16_Dca009078 [Dendrobium catenatum]